MEQQTQTNFNLAIQALKDAILKSRYRAATLVNRELLSLYYGIGKFISENSRNHFWGTNAIETISAKLQYELPGLRGFSPVNIKRMRQFYEEWEKYIQTTENQNSIIRPLSADEIQTDLLLVKRPSVTDDLVNLNFDHFLAIGFTHHYEILIKTKTVEERLFYISKCAMEFWSVEKLKYNLKISLFQKQGSLPNNFENTIQNTNLQKQALQSFKDEYLLDFINIEDLDELDERLLENEIVLHIKKFIMALGNDFSFMGNQYRLEVDEKEFFIDLLFFNRRIQCLVAIELKRGEFKPEYAGKLNFYLSALDEYIKLPHENPSIGIILCKSQSKKIVEFAFRDTSKPMGVATYQLATQLPEQYRNILPDAETLKKLL
ncbi:MAG: PDDEXK nuclease domain-containing protein [Bacteroidales bacterium]|nr:PDDEXK nuclease domain-containing protein [Bacteroidales bacterium]